MRPKINDGDLAQRIIRRRRRLGIDQHDQVWDGVYLSSPRLTSAQPGTRELLLVDRKPWALELDRLEAGVLRLVGKSTLEGPQILTSAVLPLRFRLVEGEARPRIRVEPAVGLQTWLARASVAAISASRWRSSHSRASRLLATRRSSWAS